MHGEHRIITKKLWLLKPITRNHLFEMKVDIRKHRKSPNFVHNSSWNHVWKSSNRFILIIQMPTRFNFFLCSLFGVKSSTCFECPLRPSSGTLKTVVTATGFCHELGWNKSCNRCQTRYAL